MTSSAVRNRWSQVSRKSCVAPFRASRRLHRLPTAEAVGYESPGPSGAETSTNSSLRLCGQGGSGKMRMGPIGDAWLRLVFCPTMENLIVNERITIPAAELEIAFARAGGPGGQHVNKVESKVEIRWRPAESAVLSAEDLAPAAGTAWRAAHVRGGVDCYLAPHARSGSQPRGCTGEAGCVDPREPQTPQAAPQDASEPAVGREAPTTEEGAVAGQARAAGDAEGRVVGSRQGARPSGSVVRQPSLQSALQVQFRI